MKRSKASVLSLQLFLGAQTSVHQAFTVWNCHATVVRVNARTLPVIYKLSCDPRVV